MPRTIIENGVPRDATAEEEAQFDADAAADAAPRIARAIIAAKIKRDCLAGLTVWDGSPFQTRPEDGPNILGAVLAVQGGQWPTAGVPWRLADNSWRTLAAADVLAVFAAASARRAACFAAFGADEVHLQSGGTGTPALDALAAAQ